MQCHAGSGFTCRDTLVAACATGLPAVEGVRAPVTPGVLHQSSTGCARALRSGVLSRTCGLTNRPSRITKKVIAMTATGQRRQRSWRVMAAMRRAAGTLRYANDELLRANEAIFRPVGAPPPSPPAGASVSSATTVTGSAGAAAREDTGRAA